MHPLAAFYRSSFSPSFPFQHCLPCIGYLPFFFQTLFPFLSTCYLPSFLGALFLSSSFLFPSLIYQSFLLIFLPTTCNLFSVFLLCLFSSVWPSFFFLSFLHPTLSAFPSFPSLFLLLYFLLSFYFVFVYTFSPSSFFPSFSFISPWFFASLLFFFIPSSYFVFLSSNFLCFHYLFLACNFKVFNVLLPSFLFFPSSSCFLLSLLNSFFTFLLYSFLLQTLRFLSFLIPALFSFLPTVFFFLLPCNFFFLLFFSFLSCFSLFPMQLCILCLSVLLASLPSVILLSFFLHFCMHLSFFVLLTVWYLRRKWSQCYTHYNSNGAPWTRTSMQTFILNSQPGWSFRTAWQNPRNSKL